MKRQKKAESFKNGFILAGISMFLVSCAVNQYYVDPSREAAWNDRSFAVAEFPGALITDSIWKSSQGEVLKPTWNMNDLKIATEQFMRTEWSQFYSGSVQPDSSLSGCFNWKNAKPYAGAYILRNTRLPNVRDTVQVILPEVEQHCSSNKKDLIVVPSIALVSSVLRTTIYRDSYGSSVTHELLPYSTFGFGVWDVKNQKWLRVMATEIESLSDSKPFRRQRQSFVLHRQNFDHLPQTKNGQDYLKQIRGKNVRGLEVIPSIGVMGLRLDDETDQSFKVPEGSVDHHFILNLQARYFWSQWGVQFGREIIYGYYPSETVADAYREPKYISELAYQINRWQMGAVYSPKQFLRVDGRSIVKITYGGGLLMDQIAEWKTKNQFGVENVKSLTIPENLYGGYLNASLDVYYGFGFYSNFSLEGSFSLDGTTTTRGFGINLAPIGLRF